MGKDKTDYPQSWNPQRVRYPGVERNKLLQSCTEWIDSSYFVKPNISLGIGIRINPATPIMFLSLIPELDLHKNPLKSSSSEMSTYSKPLHNISKTSTILKYLEGHSKRCQFVKLILLSSCCSGFSSERLLAYVWKAIVAVMELVFQQQPMLSYHFFHFDAYYSSFTQA